MLGIIDVILPNVDEPKPPEEKEKSYACSESWDKRSEKLKDIMRELKTSGVDCVEDRATQLSDKSKIKGVGELAALVVTSRPASWDQGAHQRRPGHQAD